MNGFALLEHGMALLLSLVLIQRYSPFAPYFACTHRCTSPSQSTYIGLGSPFYPAQVCYNLPRWILLYRYPSSIPFPFAMLRPERIKEKREYVYSIVCM